MLYTKPAPKFGIQAISRVLIKAICVRSVQKKCAFKGAKINKCGTQVPASNECAGC